MLTGEQIRTARKRARMSQGELAAAVGASLRAVGSWERDENSPNLAEVRLREVLGPYLAEDGASGPGLEDASDAQLLAEIARRFARADTQGKAGEGHEHGSAPITELRERRGNKYLDAATTQVDAARDDPKDPK